MEILYLSIGKYLEKDIKRLELPLQSGVASSLKCKGKKTALKHQREHKDLLLRFGKEQRREKFSESLEVC